MLKRSFDIFASFFGLIVLTPLFLIIAFLIMILTPGPVLFRQERTGRYGKPFTIYKFRTMKVNHGGNTVSVVGESRITPLGRLLRKHKLDELPELWNVLQGGMSLVGPRPDMPEYAGMLVGEEKLILNLRPGITGPASLKYREEEKILATVPDPKRYNDEVLWPNKVRINLEYYRKSSFSSDVLIILRTIFGQKV